MSNNIFNLVPGGPQEDIRDKQDATRQRMDDEFTARTHSYMIFSVNEETGEVEFISNMGRYEVNYHLDQMKLGILVPDV
jgi:hypothetical protein